MKKGLCFDTLDGKTYKLTEKEKAFCELYACYGVSGVEAAKYAGYEVSKPTTLYSIASENLRKPKILAYIAKLYNEHNFSDDEVMREHMFLIRQHANLNAKAKAIDMYYRKKRFYDDEKHETPTTVIVNKYASLTDQEIEKYVNSFQKFANMSKEEIRMQLTRLRD